MKSTIETTKELTSLAEYRELRQTFQLDCPEFFNFGTDVVDRWAAAATGSSCDAVGQRRRARSCDHVR